MLQKKGLIVYMWMLLAIAGYAQTNRDTIPAAIDQDLAIDTSLEYDDVLSELESFLDSLLSPRSYFLVSASAGNGYFNYKKGNAELETKKKLVFSPALGYYHKSGPGITLSGNLIDDGRKYNLYQYGISPSFDFIRSRKWVGGVSYTRYIIKDDLPFYTPPLQNEINTWFVWRKSWLQPGLAANYGWGGRDELEKRKRYIELFSIRRPGAIVTTTEETIADFSVTASLRHTFYWLSLLKNNDYIKFTPLLTFSSGTQKFGFNQTTGIHTINTRHNDNAKYNTGNVNLDDRLEFQPLSATLYLRPEYATGKFFIQPQFILDYYFPATGKNLTMLFSVNTGFIF